ncbi:SDR family oxidoreductase [Bradyrhizobium tropiciagri]|uniref:SDR family NAD(P)-dependent oxidoreductase n=1 Tax=Bradyrhizobium tropiciagri TaxID=312253 RepID=UPI001BA7732D|nr:SDR family oxidoreductase [Bradyrhizobium tropiciagri]MBR0899157.1 SDR family oxidoreductase [Bradyrhizobium tropiciagri]
MTADNVKRRRALVAGGASGIGAATAVRLTATGADVLIADIDAAKGARLAGEIGATFVAVDLTDHVAVSAALAQRDPFDILVNSAGADQHAFFTQTGPQDWARLIALNLGAVLNTTHAVLPGMQQVGYGRIVNVASEAGRLGSKGASVYAAAKGGVIAFTRSIARENGRMGITANVVAPGPIDTPMLRRAIEDGGEKLMTAMTSATLVGRLGTPQETAAVIAFLASDEAGYVTGEVLGASGGMGCGA